MHPTLSEHEPKPGLPGISGEDRPASGGQPTLAMPIDEALRRLKAEIIAPDWRLTPARIALLESALGSMHDALAARRDALAVVTMAENVLRYIKRHQALAAYILLAFLKEAMALAVSLHEEGAPDPEQDSRTFRAVYQRFQGVKASLRGGGGTKRGGPAPAMPGTDLELDVEDDSSNDHRVKKVSLWHLVEGLTRDVQVLTDRVEAQGELLTRLLARLDQKPPG